MIAPQKIIKPLLHKKICILGFGREGLSTYNFLRQHLPDQKIALLDQTNFSELNPEIKQVVKNDPYLELRFGSDYLANLEEFDLIFKTPGIQLNQPALKKALKSGVKISSNLQLFLEIITATQDRPIKISFKGKTSTLFQPIVIGVTGTKGKSTTSALIHHLLKKNGFDTLLVGNIGIPALNHINQITSKSKVVIEMSSHQLEQLSISPDIAVVQEITSEHLDYFPDEQAYIDSKKSIAMYQKVNQYIIYNPEWPTTQKTALLSPGIKLKFQVNMTDISNKNDILVYLKSYYLTFNHNNIEEQIIKIKDIPLLGRHNLENVAPAIIIGKMFGLNQQQIASAIKSFTPLPHRLQKVAVKNGVTYVNDSMATTPESAISAISCFAGQPIILFAGGHEKNQDFSQLANKILTANLKAVALFPANGPRLWNEVLKMQQKLKLLSIPKHRVVHSMAEAMKFAQDNARSGDVVLLAPGSASFGIFKDYADRGEKFVASI